MLGEVRRYKADLRPPREQVAPGSRISDYRLDKKLGQGATGAVHKAYALRGPLRSKTVAIKIILKATLTTEKRRRRIDCEVELHQRLARHPAIVKFEHAFEDDQNIYIVTEFCPGSTLFKYMQDNHPTGLPEDEARSIFLALVQAVSFLHQNDILHRDLKLTNVLLTETRQVRIADFGLATELEHASLDQEMTMCGTPNYISPEIVKRDPYGKASDVWSLGCMLVALLTGRPPFQGEQISETLHLVSKGAYRPLPRSTGRDVRNLVEAILQIDPRRRPTTSEILTHPFLVLSNVPPNKTEKTRLQYSQYTGYGDRQKVVGDLYTTRSPLSRAEQSRDAALARDDNSNGTILGRRPQAPQNAFDFGAAVQDQIRNPWNAVPVQGYRHLVETLRHDPSHIKSSSRPTDQLNRGRVDTSAVEQSSDSDATDIYQKHGELGCSSNADIQRSIVTRRPYVSLSAGGHARQYSESALPRPRPADSTRRASLNPIPFAQQGNYDSHFEAPSSGIQHPSFVPPSEPVKVADAATNTTTVSDFGLKAHSRQKSDVMSKTTRFAPGISKQAPSRSTETLATDFPRRDSACSISKGSESGGLGNIEKYKFDTYDLKATTQKNKHVELCLLPSGEITVQLAKDDRTHRISPDGDTITSTEPSGVTKTYSFEDLPARSLLAYRYASKFVHTLRSKSVKIALDSDLAKCRLYQNGAFEVILMKHERKVSFEPEARSIKIADHDAVLWKGKLDKVSAAHRDLVRHALIWWARCKDALNEPISDIDLVASETTHLSLTPTESSAKFVDGFGWCERHDEGRRWTMYFLDGVGLELFTERRSMLITDAEGATEEVKLEAGLSSDHRQRLKAISRGMKKFVDNVSA